MYTLECYIASMGLIIYNVGINLQLVAITLQCVFLFIKLSGSPVFDLASFRRKWA